MQVLVVEDDPTLISAVTNLLESQGFGIITAGDGQQALDILESGFWPDVIVLDLMLPKVSGWHVLDALQLHERWRRLPVIVTSGAPLPFATGVRAFLEKPFQAQQLVAAIRRICASQ